MRDWAEVAWIVAEVYREGRPVPEIATVLGDTSPRIVAIWVSQFCINWYDGRPVGYEDGASNFGPFQDYGERLAEVAVEALDRYLIEGGKIKVPVADHTREIASLLSYANSALREAQELQLKAGRFRQRAKKLEKKSGELVQLKRDPLDPAEVIALAEARGEHAFLLRCEGLTYQAIGTRLGCGKQQAGYILAKYRRRVVKAVRKTRFHWITQEEHP